MYKVLSRSAKGFTLVELLVVISIIAILVTVVFASFGQARAKSRDKAQLTELKNMELALKLYREINGSYPPIDILLDSCYEISYGSIDVTVSTKAPNCAQDYIDENITPRLAPEYTPKVANHTISKNPICEYRYLSDSTGSEYKILAQGCAEQATLSSGDDFARCPANCSQSYCSASPNDFAVYSEGAECW